MIFPLETQQPVNAFLKSALEILLGSV